VSDLMGCDCNPLQVDAPRDIKLWYGHNCELGRQDASAPGCCCHPSMPLTCHQLTMNITRDIWKHIGGKPGKHPKHALHQLNQAF